ncbi:MAG TPA: ABC transporter permease [Blastocatellia bacterium]|nr:ABC transporter permease [Blastocatellia bacterium]
MGNTLRDLRYSIRSLGKNPGFAAVAVLTLALGIGVNSAVFSIVNAYLFRPLPVKDPEQLVVVATKDNTLEFPYEVSYPNYEDIRDRTEVFSDVVAFQNGVVSMSADDRAERVWVEWVTGNYFSMLGVEAAIGRTFAPEEGKITASQPVVVVSHAYWKSRFGASPAAVGKTVKLNGHPLTIIGVLPESFTGTESILKLDMYLPLGLEDQLEPASAGWLKNRNDTGLRVMGRLKPGASLEQARAAVGVLASQLQQEYPVTNKGVSFFAALETNARPVISIADSIPRIAGVFSALVALVLLIACANVANLTLARATARQKEIAIRLALGASRARIIRLMLSESMVLSFLGGCGGLVLALWATDWLASIRVSTDAPVNFNLRPDWRVLAFSVLVALVAGLVSGVAPAFQTSRPNLNESLKEGGRGAGGGSTRHRIRNLLVVSQVAVSLLVLICAGLFTQSAKNAERIDLGFRTENLAMMSMDLGPQGYDKERGRQFYKQLAERVRALPGVSTVALARDTQLGYNNHTEEIVPEGRTPTPEEGRTSVFFNVVSPDYFETVGTSLLAGREFTERDNESAPGVAVVNEAMARRFWTGSDSIDGALGKRFRVGRDGPNVQVVGVARDSKYVFLGEESRSFFYTPFAQRYRSDMTLFIHSAGDPASVIAAARQVVTDIDRDLPVYDAKTMTTHLRDGIALLFVRMGAKLAGGFGLLGLVLALVGIYGVVTYSVTQRTHEIGIRVALGANRSDVLKLVLGQGFILTLAGVAIGLAGALAVTRVMSSLLYGVSTTDPLTFALVPVLLTVVALAASFIPARRAMRVDPMIALRYE